MKLLTMIEEYKQVSNKAREMEEKLCTILKEKFLALPFKMEKQEIQNPDNWAYTQEKINRVYCPVLEIPKGFYKEDFTYVRSGANSFDHEYILSNEEFEVTIKEHAAYSEQIYSTGKGKIELSYQIVLQKVYYELSICGFKCKFERTFNYEDVLEKITNKKIGIAKLEEASYLKKYFIENERYIDIIKSLGAIKESNTLRDIIESGCKQFEINQYLTAKVNVMQGNSKIGGWLENEIWQVHLNRLEFVQNNVFLKIFSKSGKEILKENFYWYEIVDKKFEEGITLEEAIKLIKE